MVYIVNMMNEDIDPTSKLGSIIVILETLAILKYADEQYKAGTPILDEFYREMGSAQFLRKILFRRYYHEQTVNYRLRKCRDYNFIKISGATYKKADQRKVPVPTGKGRSTSRRGNIVYEVTDIGEKFYKDNFYILDRFGLRGKLESLLKAFKVK